MATELQLQSKLIEEVRRQGGYGLKLSNRFMIGVPDLLLQLPGLPTVILETKFAVYPVKKTTPIHIGITPPQRNTMRKMQAAGTKVGWCLFVASKEGMNPDYHRIVTSTQLDAETISVADAEMFIIRKRGEPWPVEAIIKAICKSP